MMSSARQDAVPSSLPVIGAGLCGLCFCAVGLPLLLSTSRLNDGIAELVDFWEQQRSLIEDSTETTCSFKLDGWELGGNVSFPFELRTDGATLRPILCKVRVTAETGSVADAHVLMDVSTDDKDPEAICHNLAAMSEWPNMRIQGTNTDAVWVCGKDIFLHCYAPNPLTNCSVLFGADAEFCYTDDGCEAFSFVSAIGGFGYPADSNALDPRKFIPGNCAASSSGWTSGTTCVDSGQQLRLGDKAYFTTLLEERKEATLDEATQDWTLVGALCLFFALLYTAYVGYSCRRRYAALNPAGA